MLGIGDRDLYISHCSSRDLGSTAVIWNLKKSQAENTIKIYLSAYKEIIELKQDDSLINDMEEQIITKIDGCIEENLNDATTLIEKQEIL